MNRLNQHILAAYYNDARLNILYCLNDVRIKTGLNPVKDDGEIKSAFNSLSLMDIELERQQVLIRHLRERFHFLDVLTDLNAVKKRRVPPNQSKQEKQEAIKKEQQQKQQRKDNGSPIPQYYDTILLRLFSLIHDLRNTMVHPTDKETLIDERTHKRLLYDLSKIYDSSLATIKTRFVLDKNSIEPLLRCDEKGKAKTKAQFSLALCTDYKTRNTAEPIKQSRVLHDFGHVLLCALFLDKSQSAELMSYFWQAHPENTWTNEQKTLIKELISVYRVRLPLQRLKSDHSITAVTLDSLSELSRCPSLLLNELSPKDQNRFRVNTNQMSDENDEPSFLFARGHQNRFIPLMMRFLDFDTECKLRFAIDLGQFYYNVRLKPADKFTDQRSRVRRLGQKIVVYGCLIELEQIEKPEVWQQLEQNYLTANTETPTVSHDIQQLKPYIVPSYPHYHYDDDKIGFRITSDPAAYPTLTNDAKSNTSLTPKKGYEFAPEFWISPAQLLHLGFYSYLQKNLSNYPRIDLVLNRYRNGMIKLLEQIRTELPKFSTAPNSAARREQVQQWVNEFFTFNTPLNVSLGDLPQVLVQHLIGSTTRQCSKKDIIARAEHLLQETEHKKKQIEQLLTQSKKRGKKGFKAIKCGHIGDFLASDLVRFQPIDPSKIDTDGGKINSQNYQILQAALAYYGARLNEPPKIVDLLKDAGLLKGQFAHPFLSDLIREDQPEQYKGLISFYEAYLQARHNYLKGFIETTKAAKTIPEPPKWLRLRQTSSLENWLREQQNQPLPVPKTLLYPALLNMVAKATHISASELEQQGSKHLPNQAIIKPSITWLLKYYLARQNDSVQTMYEYPRQHKLFNTFLDIRDKKPQFQEKTSRYLTETARKDLLPEIREHIAKSKDEEEKRKDLLPKIRQHIAKSKDEEERDKLNRLLKAYKHDEQQIRDYAAQDSLLYLYAKQRLNDLQLSDKQESKPNWTLHDIENTLLDTPIHYQLLVQDSDKHLFHTDCKIRNLGEMSLLVRDRRLPTLLTFYPAAETALNQAEIRAELASRAKVQIMANVHELERQIMRRFHHVPERTKEEKEQTEAHFGKARHGDFLYLLYQKAQQSQPQGFDLDSFKQALAVRNAFSHNQYPDSALFPHIMANIQKEAIPENPAQHRKIALKLLDILEQRYQPWLNFLATDK